MEASSETRFVSISQDAEVELPPTSLPAGLRSGLVVGDKYELLRQLGIGSMGEVWAARHRTLDEEVAIKLVKRDFDHTDGTSTASRFLLEARVAASLSRKTRHIVSVTDHGEDGMLGYLVMELLPGKPLDAHIAESGPMSLAAMVPFIVQLARGLEVAHAEGVVHRDLKPSNVFVSTDEDGRALLKILDFGIAKLRRPADSRSPHSTQRGFLLGTPAYMSPEQARGRPNLDHRSDVWALAVLAFHLLTGKFPFDGHSPEELFARLCRFEPTPIRELRPDLPPLVAALFERAFAEDIGKRFDSALALASAFERIVAHAKRLESTPNEFPVPGRSLAMVLSGAAPRSALVSTPAPNAVEAVSRRAPTKSEPAVPSGVPSKRLAPALVALLLLVGLFGVAVFLVTLSNNHVASRSVAIVEQSAPSTLTSSSAAMIELPDDEDVPPPTPRAAMPAGAASASPATRTVSLDVRSSSGVAPSRPPAAPKAHRTIDKSDVF